MVKSSKSIIFQAMPVLLACVPILIGSGLVLSSMEENFRVGGNYVPGLIVMIPPLLALRGNVSGALASRLGSALHQGVIKPEFLWDPEMKANIFSAISLALLGSLTTGILAYLVSFLSGLKAVAFFNLVAIALIAGLLSSILQMGVTISVAILSYAKGIDPDNVTSPLVTSIGDLLTIACIYIAVLLVV